MLRRVIMRDQECGGWLLFEAPRDVLVATDPAGVPSLIAEVAAATEHGAIAAAGFLAYEAAGGFDPVLRTHSPDARPIACFGLFPPPTRHRSLPGPPAAGSPAVRPWGLTASREDYGEKIAVIRQQIALGNTYQVNFTLRLASRVEGGGWPLFRRISTEAPYAAWLDCDDFAIVSASPELFFHLDGNRIVCRPMKGTARRGMTTSEDRAIAVALEQSQKNRAENVMITDMVRNDLGRIAEPGSVGVDELFTIEKYATLWQMTSTISATTAAGPGEILAALFPCASITGAPKKSSMDIIASLEDGPRGIYTGAIGWLGPGRRASFSVAIRTAVVDKPDGQATYGVGGGIVWDSDPEEEYDECLLKARVLGTMSGGGDFELIETLRWSADDGWFLGDLHLERLRDSAEYFDFRFERETIESALSAAIADSGLPLARVRLLLARDGTPSVTVTPLDMPGRPPIVRLAAAPVDPLDPFLYHKTTRRAVYENALDAVPGADDVLLYNPDGFITETTIANVIVDSGDRRITPPVADGLLGGVYRRWLLESGEIEERSVHLNELGRFDEVTLVNSVRGEYPVRFEPAPAPGRRA